MSYNKDDYIKVRNEFETKYQRARGEAEARTFEVHALIPEIVEIDRVLAGTGMDIMAVIGSADPDKEGQVKRLEQRNNELIARRNALLVAHGFTEDYTDVKYDCPACGDTGYTESGMCACMKRAISAQAYNSSGLGRLIGEQTFDNFDLSYYADEHQPRMESYVKELESFSDSFDSKTYGNFLFIGTTGLGKTHLSTAVAQRVIERGYDVLYVSSVKMIGDFEAERFGNEMGQKSVDLSRYYGADLLIIDDLGAEIVNKFTQTYLYNVINTRINEHRCTIINTNLTPSELNKMYTERVSSRLLGEYIPMLFRGTDIRKKKNLLFF